MRHLFAFALLCLLLVSRPAAAQDVLVPGDPPLTAEMAKNYLRFMQWTLDTPLTLAQEERLRTNLKTAWEVNDRVEIGRVLNLLALRSGIEEMHLQDDPQAKRVVQKEALRNWNRSPSSEMARWGLPMFDASHKSIIEGPAPLTRQMVEAYQEMGTFIVTEVYGAPSNKLDVEEKVQLSDTLGSAFRTLSTEQKDNFKQLPALWVQLRSAWPSLSDGDKAALRADWKAHFEPKPAAAAAKKGAPPAAAPRTQPQMGLLGRLSRMTWLSNPEVVAKLSAVGGEPFAYKSGW